MKESSENTCKTFAEHISAYVDGQLSGELLETVEKHLQACPHCARQLEHYNLFKNLINSEHQNCPVDLTSVVMAGLERDHLLQGLESLSKPPTPRWIKLVRAFSAAAMLALIASAGLIIMNFTSSGKKSSVSINQTPPAMTQNMKLEKSVAPPPPQEPIYEAPSRETPFDLPASSAIAQESKDTIELPVLAKKVPVEKRVFSSRASEPRTLADAADSTEESCGVPMGFTAETSPAKPNAPLALRPSPASSSLPSTSDLPKNGGRAWPVELVYQLNSSDLPGWMLLKEQVVIALMENDIPSLQDSYDVAQALENNEEFFYQAKKGLDLPPGSRSVQILLVTRPQTFAKIHASLQQAMSETNRQELSPELKNYLHSQTITPELADRTQSTFAALDRIWGITKSRPALTTTQTTSQPTTIAAVTTSSAPASQPIGRAALRACRILSTTTSAPAPTTSFATRPAISQLPILIKIEIAKPTPTTTTTTAPATQTTTSSTR